MKLYCHIDHDYEDRGRHTEYVFRHGGVYDVPVDVAQYMVQAHPDRFCVIEEEAPDKDHRCAKGSVAPSLVYEHREIEAPPKDKQAVSLRGRPRIRDKVR